jgi:hypothetical protein
MSASHKTVVDVRRVLLKYLSREQATALLVDLNGVDGNASFRETIRLLTIALAEVD